MVLSVLVFWCFIVTVIDVVGFEAMSDFLFDMVFWAILSPKSNTKSEDDKGNGTFTTGSASVGSSTAKALDAALNSNHRFHHVLAVLRKERSILKGISAQDQFARWAKQKRLVDALEEKANSLLKDYRFKKMAFAFPATWFLKFVVWGGTLLFSIFYRNTVIFGPEDGSAFNAKQLFSMAPSKSNIVDNFIVDFLEFVLAFPFGPAGSVSAISMFFLFRICFTRLTRDFIRPSILAYVKSQNTP